MSCYIIFCNLPPETHRAPYTSHSHYMAPQSWHFETKISRKMTQTQLNYTAWPVHGSFLHMAPLCGKWIYIHGCLTILSLHFKATTFAQSTTIQQNKLINQIKSNPRFASRCVLFSLIWAGLFFPNQKNENDAAIVISCHIKALPLLFSLYLVWSRCWMKETVIL